MTTVFKNLGPLFIISFPEATPRDETLYFIKDNKIGGIILFAAHCRDQDNLKSWLPDLKADLDYNLIVAVDQEGGRVRRFVNRFPELEAPRFYGEHGKLERYRDDLRRVCERLREIGVNLNLVPTVDLFDSGKGHVLDTRTFSENIDTVNQFAGTTIAVHHEMGLLTCGKHFPGLGRSSGDPHYGLAAADLEEGDFFEKELVPFKYIIENGIDSIMVTHQSVPRVDKNLSILSSKIITGWLRDRLLFDSAVISDDLLMEGAQKEVPLPQLAKEAVNAGVDLLLFGQDDEKGKEALEFLREQVEDGKVSGDRVNKALSRVRALSDKIGF